MQTYLEQFERLKHILDELRVKCPWDRKQTIFSLRQLTAEECYELSDAIISEDWNGIREELGDLLLHIVFYARIAEEEGRFTMEELIKGICDKLVERHPHVYGDQRLENEEQVKQNWEKLKLKEGKKSVLEGLPRSLPPMIKAMRIQEKARQVGFEWETTEAVREKIHEELGELESALQCSRESKEENGGMREVEDEFGDVFFSMINYARFLRIDAEKALEHTNLKFIERFRAMEDKAAQMGKTLTDMRLEEMDEIWNEIKRTSPST